MVKTFVMKKGYETERYILYHEEKTKGGLADWLIVTKDYTSGGDEVGCEMSVAVSK